MFCSLAILPPSTTHASEKITFKPVVAAILKMDNRQVKNWNVYTGNKEGTLILVQIGERYLVVDTERREVTELAPRMVERKDKEVHWEQKEKSTAEGPSAPRKNVEKAGGVNVQPVPDVRVLPTDDWDIRDRGRARTIKVRLKDEGRQLEVQLPLAPDQRFY